MEDTAQETPSILEEGEIDDLPTLGGAWQGVHYLSHVLDDATEA